MTTKGYSIRPFIELTRQLLVSPSLEQALGLVCEAAMRILPAEHASVRVVDGSEQRLLSGARRGDGAEAAPIQFAPGRGVAGWVVAQGRSVRLDDAPADQRFVAMAPSLQGFEPRSLLGAPLWSGQRAVGVLGVTSSAKGAFDEEDELALTLLANCASPMLERARLERLTITDPLTLAFNHRYLEPRLAEELARAGRRQGQLSLLLMDLDHFKRVNDEHGHAVGDQVLREFVERVREQVRVSDVLVRRGGEEFVLVMPEMGRDDALRAAERIRARMASEPVQADDALQLAQTVSIGIAVWDGATSAAELESRADAAMYAAKRAGRDRVRIAE
jgi:two-component system cell cycle response regulator